MVAAVEALQQCALEREPGDGRRERRGEHGEQEGAGGGLRRGAGEGADHVERAVREVDEVHDAEDERQARRHQEQHHAELHAVQKLLGDERKGHDPAPFETVMPAFVAGVHDVPPGNAGRGQTFPLQSPRAWMAGASPAMT